ncbi:hypothetical protein [Acidipropionibacterium jensenii]|uniref:hypothetical protein n=1 Tax=Acidipropionibacterium jensenii TaxID=1749 RepID=UPI001C2F7215|nr:hypothetical protein [Acidipropionibacterium jensenii]
MVLALVLGGGFWWLNRQPTMDPDEAGNVFSPAIMSLTNNSYYGSIDGNGQYSGDEVRANLSRTKFHGDALNSCISAVKQKMTHVDMLQVLASSQRPTFSTNGDALPTDDSSSSSGLATGGCLVRYGNTITLAARKAEDKGGAGSPSLSDIDCAEFAQSVSSRIDHLA